MVVDVVLPAVLGLVHVRKAGVGACENGRVSSPSTYFEAIESFAKARARISSGGSLPAVELLASGHDQTIFSREGLSHVPVTNLKGLVTSS